MTIRPPSATRARFAVAVLVRALAFVCTASNAYAQAAADSDPWAGVEEMIVTGGAGIADLLGAPSSVVAFDQTDLTAMGAQNISDLAEYTPNLEINSPYAASNPQLFIRGVGLQDSNSNASSAVMVVVDGVYLNSPAGQLSSLFDIASVEVLRGPQGTLYGRNASAGVVRVTTNRPVHEAKAGGSVTYGRFNQLEFEGFVNVPVVQDVVATRVAFRYAKRDPLGENRCYRDRDNNFPTSTIRLVGTKCYNGMVASARPFNSPVARPPKDTNDRENWFGRSVWLVEPSEALRFDLNLHGGQNLGLAPQFQNRGSVNIQNGTATLPDITATSRRYVDFDTCHAFADNGDCLRNDRFAGAGDPFSGDYSRGGKERLTLYGATLNSAWESGPWSASSVTNYEFNDREVVIDFDASPYVEADAYVTDTAWQFLEDAQLVWDDDTGLKLTVGAQFFREVLEADNLIWNTPRSALAQEFEQKTTAAAGFGYLEFELTENVILEGGARVNYERKTFGISTSLNPYIGDQFIEAVDGYQNRRELSEQVRPSGDIILRYNPTEDLKFYSRFSRGHKGRHFNGNALSPSQPIDPVRAESINSYEVGWKSGWLDGLIQWDGAVFYYDYENQQVYQLLDAGVPVPVPILQNANDSRNIGLESELTLSWEGINWYNSVGFAYTEYSDFKVINEDVSVGPGGVTIQRDINDYSGNQLVNAPAFTLVGSLSYDWALPIGGTLIPRIDYRYKGQVFYTPENDSRIGADPRFIFDVRADYRIANGAITIAGWVRNVMDEYFPVTGFDRKKRTGAIVYVVSEPRTFGLTISYEY